MEAPDLVNYGLHLLQLTLNELEANTVSVSYAEKPCVFLVIFPIFTSILNAKCIVDVSLTFKTVAR